MAITKKEGFLLFNARNYEVMEYGSGNCGDSYRVLCIGKSLYFYSVVWDAEIWIAKIPLQNFSNEADLNLLISESRFEQKKFSINCNAEEGFIEKKGGSPFYNVLYSLLCSAGKGLYPSAEKEFMSRRRDIIKVVKLQAGILPKEVNMFDVEKTINENINIILERMETRKRVTEKAKKELKDILSFFSDKCSDSVSGYESDKEFYVKYTKWTGSDFYSGEGLSSFAMENGDALILIKDNRNDNYTQEVSISDIVYMNFDSAVIALNDFLTKLSEIKTFEISEQKITAIQSIIASGKVSDAK